MYLTEYDDACCPYYMSEQGHKFVIPDRDYDRFLEEIAFEKGKYSDLYLYEDVRMLLGCKRFVKRKTKITPI